jgi:hypothetical protein
MDSGSEVVVLELAESVPDEIVIEPFEVSSSNEAVVSEPLAFPKRTPAMWDLEDFVKSTSASLNLIEPLEVLASNFNGVRLDKLTLI